MNKPQDSVDAMVSSITTQTRLEGVLKLMVRPLFWTDSIARTIVSKRLDEVCPEVSSLATCLVIEQDAEIRKFIHTMATRTSGRQYRQSESLSIVSIGMNTPTETPGCAAMLEAYVAKAAQRGIILDQTWKTNILSLAREVARCKIMMDIDKQALAREFAANESFSSMRKPESSSGRQAAGATQAWPSQPASASQAKTSQPVSSKQAKASQSATGEAKPAPRMSLSEQMRRLQIALNTEGPFRNSFLDPSRAAPAAQPQTGAVAVSAQGTTSAAERKDKSKASACGRALPTPYVSHYDDDEDSDFDRDDKTYVKEFHFLVSLYEEDKNGKDGRIVLKPAGRGFLELGTCRNEDTNEVESYVAITAREHWKLVADFVITHDLK